MAITSMGDRDLEDAPTEKLPVLSDAVPEHPPTGSVQEAIDPALLANLPLLTEQWQRISLELRGDLPLLTDALPENDAERDILAVAAARERQLTKTLEQFERLKQQAARVREALVTRQSSAPDTAQLAATASELEQLAALRDYVTGRKRWWHDMEREVESARRRIRELEIELAQRSERQVAAEALADRHSERASRLRAQLASSARELQQLREQGQARTA
jgi:chromosome segregation ATPase